MNYFSFIADFIFFSVAEPPTVPVTNFFPTCASVLHQNVKNRSRLDGGLLPFLYTPIELQKSHLDKHDVCFRHRYHIGHRCFMGGIFRIQRKLK